MDPAVTARPGVILLDLLSYLAFGHNVSPVAALPYLHVNQASPLCYLTKLLSSMAAVNMVIVCPPDL